MDKSFKGTHEEYIKFRSKRNEANKRYYNKTEVRERKKKYSKEYRRKNKEKISEYGKKYYERPENKNRRKNWREKNIEKLKEYYKLPRVKEAKKISDKKYLLKNREKVNKSHYSWRNKNKKVVKEYNQKYYTSPKGIIIAKKNNHRRIALIKERPFDLTKENIEKIINRDRVCVYCGSSENLELDHIISLKNGGNSLFNNFVLACAKCNRTKSGRDVFEWCKIKDIEVPKIIIELLNKQN